MKACCDFFGGDTVHRIMPAWRRDDIEKPETDERKVPATVSNECFSIGVRFIGLRIQV